ncbi:MAG: hypothetical protein K2X47_04585 [Bdellovibrionales bacterium]|nr:hypothetical protein [Bdellovibrionales bacterium]
MHCRCICTCGFRKPRIVKEKEIDRRKFWTEELLIAALKALISEGIDIRYRHFVSADSKVVRKITLKAIGRKVTARSIYNQSQRMRMSWRDLAQRAGLSDVETVIKKRGFWTRDLVVESVQSLHSAGFDLNTKAIRWDLSTGKAKLLRNLTGENVTGHGLYKTGIKLFGSWNSCLVAAGIDPKNARFQRRRQSLWDKNMIIRVIRELYVAGFALNTKNIRWDICEEKTALLKKITGRKTSGYGLYRTGEKLFGSWANSISAAGLDPKKIKFVRPKTAKSRYAHLPIHYEDVPIDGGIRTVGFLGFAPETPEERLVSITRLEKVKSFVQQASAKRSENFGENNIGFIRR